MVDFGLKFWSREVYSLTITVRERAYLKTVYVIKKAIAEEAIKTEPYIKDEASLITGW